MSDRPDLPQPPSNEEISARLRRAAERALEAHAEEDEKDPFLALKRELANDDLARMGDEILPTGPKVPEHDPEFAERLEKLTNRVDQARAQKTEVVKRQEKVWKSEQDNAKGLGTGLVIAYMFLGFPMVGVLLGLAVNHFAGTQMGIPVGGMIGVLIGCGLALRALNYSNRNS